LIMSPSNFEILANENPRLRREILRVGEWVHQHADWNLIDLRVLSKDMRDLDPGLLTIALGRLVDSGAFRRVYKVVTPSGVLAEGDFDDPTTVPELVRDHWGHSFETADADIVPVLKPAWAGRSAHG
jgi:hypothetical protein